MTADMTDAAAAATAAGTQDNNADSQSPPSPLAKLQVADSAFLGYAIDGIQEPSQVSNYHNKIKKLHPNATHIPYAWQLSFTSDNDDDGGNNLSTTPTTTTTPSSPNSKRTSGFGEDGEPKGSTGPYLLEQVRECLEENKKSNNNTNGGGILVVVVRYFGSQLLGVTCGRLSQCYQRVAQLTLHRLIHGINNNVPFELDFSASTTYATNLPGIPVGNVYGLGSGDTELHLNVIQGEKDTLMTTILEELDFGGFKGAEGEVLPRLQNLQSDFYKYDRDIDGPIIVSNITTTDDDDGGHVSGGGGTIIPVYRYPGNYQGDEWETFRWKPLSLEIKEKVETTLPHFYDGQKMNHCVTNYYRNSNDFIGHHSDKDLDLNKHGAIVSVSIGDERILELKRRAEPRDVTRLLLPHGSMLLLGPITNQYFTHSILPAKEEDTGNEETTGTTTSTTKNGGNNNDKKKKKYDEYARISLTLRHVVTYMDTTNRRLFGEGVKDCPTLHDLRRSRQWETINFVVGFASIWKSFWVYTARNYTLPTTITNALPWSVSGRIPALPSSSSSSSGSSSSTTTSSSTISSRREQVTTIQSIIQEGMIVLGCSVISWWSYSKFLQWYHQRKEEASAREFFTKKSTSGTKY